MEETQGAESLRAKLLEHLREFQIALADDVAEAMLAVPRHLFLPGVPWERAYGMDPVVTHWDDEGVPISSASAPGTVAGMLEQADVRPGHRVLEIGSGTGYNAALLAHLVGPAGAVTTIEYNARVADAARSALTAYGADRVRVVTGDGTLGASDDAPFDRILVTAGAWDVAPAWRQQLVPGGRLVLPLRLRGLTRVTAFELDGDVLRSVSVVEDGFIPMKGIGAVAEQNIRIGSGPDLTLRIDDGQPVDTTALAEVLNGEPVIIWSEVEAPWGWTENQDFWIAAMPGFCRVFVNTDAVSDGRVPRPKDPWGSWGVFSSTSLAYLTVRRVGGVDDMPMLQVGACGFGPDGASLAEGLVNRVSAWRRETGDGLDVTIEAHRKDSPVVTSNEDALVVIDKADHTFVVRASETASATV